MQYTYKTTGTCSQEIAFEIEDGKLKNVRFLGGCNGNLKGIGALVEGMSVEAVSYTHLDVYKRQALVWRKASMSL